MLEVRQNSSVQHTARDDPMFIVLNVGSGRNELRERVETLRNVFDEAGQRYEILIVDEVQNLSNVTRQAVSLARQRHGVVVAAGGDGTISAVAREVLPSSCPFGVLPHGTFNFFSRAHNIPSDMAAAARALVYSTVQPVQVGMVNQQVFLVNASLGLYARVFEDREYLKKKFGRSQLVALGAMFVTLLREHRRLTLHLSSEARTEVIHALSLVVGNNALQLERLGIPEVPALQHGLLIAIALRPVGVLGLLKLASQGALGQLHNAEQVKSFAFQRLTVNRHSVFGPRRLRVALDGELTWLTLPLVFAVSPTPLYLLVPGPEAA